MTDELRKKLTERFELIVNMFGDNAVDDLMREALLKAYLAGREYGYEYAVEKACEWLSNFNAYRICLEGHKADFIELFRKAMDK